MIGFIDHPDRLGIACLVPRVVRVEGKAVLITGPGYTALVISVGELVMVLFAQGLQIGGVELAVRCSPDREDVVDVDSPLAASLHLTEGEADQLRVPHPLPLR
jgi:hypothetical protein